MGNDEPCEFLPWDTEFFDRRIARVRGHQLDPPRAQEILDWCRLHSIECLYFLADANHPETVATAEAHGFRFVDIRVTLQCTTRGRQISTPEKSAPEVTIRLSRQEDIPFLEAIARDCHVDSRFFFDPGFPTALCAALYETWIRRSCEEYADAVLVAEMKGEPVGYVTCHLNRDPLSGQIGLVGLGAQVRGLGLGQRLIAQSLDWFARQGVKEVSVVTQGRNIAAQRLYQRCGFLTQSTQLWYHKWFTERTSGGNP